MGVVSIGGVDFDIYGEHTSNAGPTISAVSYFNASLNVSAWTDAGFINQQKALVNASRLFDKQRWQGTVTDPTTPQPLAWPRTGVPACDGITVSPTVTPDKVIFGAYELAAAILADAQVQTAGTTGSNVRRVLARKKVGDLEIEDETEYFIPTITGQATSGRFPPQVQEYLKCFVESYSMGATVTGSTPSVFLDFDFKLNSPGNL